MCCLNGEFWTRELFLTCEKLDEVLRCVDCTPAPAAAAAATAAVGDFGDDFGDC